jgi:hypothetical protein
MPSFWRSCSPQRHTGPSKTVFEVTPNRFESDAFGYGTPSQDLTLKFVEAVEVSGAALDSTQMVAGASQRVIFSAINIDTGRFINNYKQPFWTNAWNAVPVFYLLPSNTAYFRDAYGARMYLTDGGYAENLGAWSLIRRDCEQIIIADAEFDPNYTFEAYFKLKRALEEEMHVKLDLDKIARTPEEEDECKTVKGEDPRCSYRDIDDIPQLIEDKRSLSTRSSSPGPFPEAFVPSQAVLHGSIGVFPYLNNQGRVEEHKIDVIYIKMAVDPHDLDNSKKYGATALEYAKASAKNTCRLNPRLLSIFYTCQFPHYSTSRQNYSLEQFSAYVDLGDHLVCYFLTDGGPNGGLKLKDTTSTSSLK